MRVVREWLLIGIMDLDEEKKGVCWCFERECRRSKVRSMYMPCLKSRAGAALQVNDNGLAQQLWAWLMVWFSIGQVRLGITKFGLHHKEGNKEGKT